VTIAMLREVAYTEPPHSPAVLELVEAMLGDDPIDAALAAKVMDPALAEARARADADLRQADWPNLGRYQGDNAKIIASGMRPDLVFMGDSITETWRVADPGFFRPGRVCRGIAGQTSPQMLVRFWPDVIALRPRAVHILGGTNDIAGNTGPSTPHRFQCNLRAMAELALGHGVRVLLGALPPAGAFPWAGGEDPRPWIAELNGELRTLAAERGLTFVDYHRPLAVGTGAMRAEFTNDGVHPNRRGFEVMRQTLEAHL
jgi:hypothetical protein